MTRCTCKTRKNTHPFRRLFLFLVAAVIGFSIILSVSAKEHHNAPNAPLPYPLAVGSNFSLTTQDNHSLDCVTAYAWEDGSAVAYCVEGTQSDTVYMAHDPETDTWSVWHGCMKLRRHKEPRRYFTEPYQCWGPSILSQQER